jgi:hypothetical protein
VVHDRDGTWRIDLIAVVVGAAQIRDGNTRQGVGAGPSPAWP